MIGKYLLNIAHGFDVLANTILFGQVESISSRLGKLKEKHGGKIPDKYPVAQILDAALEAIDENHSIEAIDRDAKGFELKFKVQDQSNLDDITSPAASKPTGINIG